MTFEERLEEPEHRPTRRWTSRSLPAPRLDKVVAPSTDLYFIESECTERHVKIGIASNPQRRLIKLQMCCPYRLRMLAVFPGKASMEKEVHQRLIADRLHGEWFRRSAGLLSVIEELYASARPKLL